MRRLLWGAAAIAAFGFQAAHAETTGHIDGGYAFTNYNSGSDFDAYSIGGAVQTDVGDWTVQLDGRTVLQTWSSDCCDDSHGYAAVHAGTKAGNWEVGGFLGILNYYGDGGKMIGLEARTSSGDFSFQGSAAYVGFDWWTDYYAYDVRLDGDYFFSPNFALTGNLGETWFTFDTTDYEATDAGIGLAYQFSNGMELNGGYQYSNFDVSNGGTDYDTDTFWIGLSYHLNGGTLQDETNHGASWRGAQDLQDTFQRW